MRIRDWSSDVCSSDLDQAIMLVEGEARRAAAAQQLLGVARLLLEARQFVGIDFLLRGLAFRDPLEQQPGPVGRSDGRTHEQRQIMLINENPLGGDARPTFTVEHGGATVIASLWVWWFQHRSLQVVACSLK